MSILSCKMCGGELEIEAGSQIAKCRYCGTKQTVPKLDSEKKSTLFARANRLRFNSEFDKAAGVYESIVAEFPEEAEAYWGLVLCKYGIEYVDDPATAKKIPTCHRSSYESILDDTDYEQTLENATPETRVVYREEAKAIEALRQNIVEVSSKEEPYDIFICYKETDTNGNRTIDSVIAQDVYDSLTDKGYRVFFSRISLEDKLGREYEPYIFAALNSAKIMLAFGTDYEYYNAVWVKNEWSRFIKLMATDRSKTLIPCYKGIDAYDMPKEFIKLQSQDMGKVGAIQDLLRGIEKILPKKKPETKEVKTVEKVILQNNGGISIDSLLKRANIFLADGDFTNANAYAEKVLDIDPECAEAYLIKLCCDLKRKTREGLGKLKESFADNANYKKVLRFADEKLKEELNGYTAQVEENIEDAKRKKLALRKAAEEYEIAERKKCDELREKYAAASKMIAVGSGESTFALTVDGKLVATGRNDYGQCNVGWWRDIVQIATSYCHTVGLTKDGTVMAVGDNYYGKRVVDGWNEIVAVAEASNYSVGLRKNGTVVAAGVDAWGGCNVSEWRNIVAIAAGNNHTAGLKSDGTVVVAGTNDKHNVSGWSDIIAISAGGDHTVGLKKDGTVVATGRNWQRQCDVFDWRHIVSVSAGGEHTLGLKPDGTVVAVGSNKGGQCNVGDWKDIVAVFAGYYYSIGLKRDGTLVAVGSNDKGQCNIQGWKLFNSIDTLEEEKNEVIRQKTERLNNEKADLKNELASLKGLFTGKRRREIEARLAGIDNQLRNLNSVKY